MSSSKLLIADVICLCPQLVEYLTSAKAELKEEGAGFDLYFRTARSFGDEGNAPVEVDFSKMIGGYVMMFLYVSLLLGNLNLVEGRFYLAIVGLLGRTKSIADVVTHTHPPIHTDFTYLCSSTSCSNTTPPKTCLNRTWASGSSSRWG